MKLSDMKDLKHGKLMQKLTDLSSNELSDLQLALKEELFRLRFRHATGQLENPLQIKKVKKDIARVKTLIRERELKA